MSSSAAANTNLTRYKPYIIAVVLAAASLGAYQVFTSTLSSSIPQADGGLHRSNAVREPRRRRLRSRAPSPANEETDPPQDHIFVREDEPPFLGAFIHLDFAERRNIWTLREAQQWHDEGRFRADRENPTDEELDIEDQFALFILCHATDHVLSAREEYTEDNAVLVWNFLQSHGIRDDFGWGYAEQTIRNMNRGQIRHAILERLHPEVLDAATVAYSTSTDIFERDLDGNMIHESDFEVLTQLLYHIGEDKARQEGYVHRGVTCNGCDMKPIRGIRWHCTNCLDFDLCSNCEALGAHEKTHLFYKVKIPAPFIGSPDQMQPVMYPGFPGGLPSTLPTDLKTTLHNETHFEFAELDGLWDQFTVLTNRHSLPKHNLLFAAAFDRTSFDKAFLPSFVSHPKRNWVYTRLFAFFDSDGDGLIGFREFVVGMSILQEKQGRERKLRAVFDGYDDDADGFVSRRDFLHMFRSYFAIQAQLTRDHLWYEEEHLNIAMAARHISEAHPLSGIFSGAPIGSVGERVPAAKVLNDAEVIERNATQPSVLDENVVTEDDTDKADRWTVVQDHGQDDLNRHERWSRRKFYIDEEEGVTAPPGFEKPNNEDDDEDDTRQPLASALRDTPEGSRPVSPRSRSSSKVRFADSEDLELETRSNASTSSRHVAERWGGYDIPEDEKDLGSDVLYQVMQQGFIELLDPLFKEKEDLAMKSEATLPERRKYSEELAMYKASKTKKEYPIRKNRPHERRLARPPTGIEPGTSAGSRSPHSPNDASSWTTDVSDSTGSSDISSTRPTHITSRHVHSTVQESFLTEDRVESISMTDADIDQTPNNSPHEGDVISAVPDEQEALMEIIPEMNEQRQSNIGNTGSLEDAVDDAIARVQRSTLDDLLSGTGFVVDNTLPKPTPDLENLDHFTGYTAASAITDAPQPPQDSILPHQRPNTPDLASQTVMTMEEFVFHPRTQKRLAYLLALNDVDEESRARGGLGRISWEEFKEAVIASKKLVLDQGFSDDRAPPLAFVEEWIDVGQM